MLSMLERSVVCIIHCFWNTLLDWFPLSPYNQPCHHHMTNQNTMCPVSHEALTIHNEFGPINVNNSGSVVRTYLPSRRLRSDHWVEKISWRRKWQLILVFLPGKSLWQRSLAGYSLWGCKSQTQLSWRNNNNIHTCIQTCALTHARHFSKRIYLELASSEGEVLKVWGKVY